MQSRLDEASLRADEAQIEQLKRQAARNGNADGNYNQQLDDWLAAIEKQLGADGNAPSGRNGTRPAGHGAGGSDGSSSQSGTANPNGADSSPALPGSNPNNAPSGRNGTQPAGDGTGGSGGSPQQGGDANPDGADISPGSPGPNKSPTETGGNADTGSNSSIPLDTPQPDLPPSTATSNAQITASAGAAAASSVDRIASSAASSVGGSTGSSITAWLTGVGANAATASQAAGGTAAEAGAAAAAATSEAADAATIAFDAGGTTAADGVAEISEEFGTDIGMRVAQSAAEAATIGGADGEMAAALTVNSALWGISSAQPGLEAIEATTMAEDTAQAAETAGLGGARAVNEAIKLGIEKDVVSVLESVAKAGGSPTQAADAAKLITDVANSDPGENGLENAQDVANTLQDVIEQGGSIDEAMEIGFTVAEFGHTGGPATTAQASDLVTTLAQHGATPADELAALQGTMEAVQVDGPGMVDVLRTAAQQAGYDGVQTVMETVEAGENFGLTPAQVTSSASNALQIQQLGGVNAASAYIEALDNVGIEGADSVLNAAQTTQASGASRADIQDAAWNASRQAQEQALATAQAETDSDTSSSDLLVQGQGDAGTSPTTSPDIAIDATLGPGFFGAVFLPDYNRLLGDLQSGAGKDTIQADARQLTEDAAKIGYRGTAEIAIDIGTSMNADGSTIGNRDDFINILKQVDPQNSQALQWYAGTSPMYEKYLEFAVEVAGRTDPAKIKQDAQDLAGTAVANGHPSLGNVAISIARSIDDGSYSQDASLNALMNGSVRTPDPAVHGFGNTDTPTLPLPPPQTDDETQAYQKLTDDLNNGATPDTIITDALALSGIAGDKHDFGTAQAALHIGEAAKAGHLNAANALVELAMAAPASDGAKLPPTLQWTSSTASKASSAHGGAASLSSTQD